MGNVVEPQQWIPRFAGMTTFGVPAALRPDTPANMGNVVEPQPWIPRFAGMTTFGVPAGSRPTNPIP